MTAFGYYIYETHDRHSMRRTTVRLYTCVSFYFDNRYFLKSSKFLVMATLCFFPFINS